MSEEGGARPDRMECSSEYWVTRKWDLDEEGMGSKKGEYHEQTRKEVHQ